LAEAGILEKYNVELLGTPLESIKQAEDRDLFKEMMKSIGQPVPESVVCETAEQARNSATKSAIAHHSPRLYPGLARAAASPGTMSNSNSSLIGLERSLIHQILLERYLERLERGRV
jgi:carbamoyl-phosphate synthase large subunit